MWRSRASGSRFCAGGGVVRSGRGRQPAGAARKRLSSAGRRGGRAAALQAQTAIQRAQGAETELLAPDALGTRFPWLDPAGVTLAAFGPRGEGWFDGMALLDLFRRGAARPG
jgi:hypothetical protein